MPLWGLWLLWLLSSHPFAFYDFLQHGEFELYSVVFVTPALYLLSRGLNQKQYPLGGWTFFLGLLIVLVSSMVYIAIQTITNVNHNILIIFSVVLLASSAALALLTTLVDCEVGILPTIIAERKSFKELDRRMDQRQEVVPTVPLAEEVVRDDAANEEQELARQFKKEGELKSADEKGA